MPASLHLLTLCPLTPASPPPRRELLHTLQALAPLWASLWNPLPSSFHPRLLVMLRNGECRGSQPN